MTSALDLLMYSDSAAETTTLLESNGICTIDSRTRTIFVPPEIVVGAVQSDKNAERIKFSCPKIVGDNLDLSKFSIRINFENVSSVDPDISIKDQYICEDASINGDNITFSWVIGKNAARYMGTIRFIVCAVKTDSDSNISIEWNTTVAQIPVLEGIEVDQPSLDENNKDIINQLLAITKTASDEAVKNVNSAKEQAITDIQNVLQPDKTLTVEGGIADAKATGNAISSLREELGNLVNGTQEVITIPDIVGSVAEYSKYSQEITKVKAGEKWVVLFNTFSSAVSIRNMPNVSYSWNGVSNPMNTKNICELQIPVDGSLRLNVEDTTYSGTYYAYNVTNKATLSNYLEKYGINGLYKIYTEKNEEYIKQYADKKLTTYGDSITANGGWQSYLKDYFGFIIENKGIGGTTVADNGNSDSFCIQNRIDTISSDSDVVIIMGGTNDCGQSIEIGDLTYSDGFDTTKFKGGLATTIRMVQNRCPNALIFVASLCGGRGNTVGENLDIPVYNSKNLTSYDYAKATKDVAEFFNIQYIPIFEECGINCWNRATYIADTVHPNDYGKKQLAKIFIKYLSSYLIN